MSPSGEQQDVKEKIVDSPHRSDPCLPLFCQSLIAVLGTMDVEKISHMMDHFESQFNNLDVRSGYMESAIASSTASAIPEDQVSDLIRMVRRVNNKGKAGWT